MSRRHAALALAAAALFGAAPAAAQDALAPPAAPGVAIPPPQPERYLLSAAAADARSLWLNPAGLAVRTEASIGADATLDRFYPGGAELRQWGASVASRGLALGWEHNRLPSGLALNAYAIALGLGDAQFSAGAARRWYRGAVGGSAWDVGTDYASGGNLRLSLLARNLGSPRLGDSTCWTTLVPGALLSAFGGRLVLGGEWEVALHGWRSVAYRLGGDVRLVAGLRLLARADLDGGLRRRALAIGLDLEVPTARFATFGTLPGSAAEVDAVGAAAALVARPPAPVP